MLETFKKIKSSKETLPSMLSNFHVEIDKSAGGYSVVASGVSRVLELSSELVRLRCRKALVAVRGRNLSLSLYENKTVEISGKIEGLEFDSAKN